MIKLLRRLLPAALVVATHAVFSQRSFVLVILGMTGVAIRTQFDPVQVAGMACCTGGCDVFAAQQIFGIGVVIEFDGLPKLGAMAGFALFTIQALMAFGTVVVLLVATDAGARRTLVIAAHLVTLDALHIDMLFGQGKARRSMVKLELFPVGLIVAISTLGTHRAFVHIILAVTNTALCGRFAVFLARHMALFTLKQQMLFTQYKVALVMVKLLLVQVNNLRLTSLVLGVAIVTGLRL